MIKIIPTSASLSLALLLFTGTLQAATKTADINLSFSHIEYVNLTGTLVGATRYFDMDYIRPPSGAAGPKVNLGTLGLDSNMSGNCLIRFDSANAYQFRHTASNKRLAFYRLWYRGKKLTKKRNKITTPCNFSPEMVQLSTRKRFRKRIKSGLYQDILTITVVTE